MSEPDTKSETIQVRVTPMTKARFHEVASRFKMHPSEVLRELVEGFLEGRVTIVPPPEKESLYNARKQD